MFPSKPDSTGKNVKPSICDFAMHYRAKEETLTEINLKDSDSETSVTPDVTAAMESEELSNLLNEEGIRDADLSDPDLKAEKSSENVDPSRSHSETRKMFRNLNEFTEKITRTVEEKISEFKSDLGSSRGRILASKHNSSMSDSEDNSECSRIPEVRSGASYSPKKSSISMDTMVGDSSPSRAESDLDFSETELRQRKRNLLSEIKLWEEQDGHVIAPKENLEIEPAVEVHENMIQEESDNEDHYFDAKDHGVVASGTADGDPPSEAEILKFLRFINEAENKKGKGLVFITMCILLLPMPSFVRGFLTCLFLVVGWYLVTEYLRAVIESHPNLPRGPFEIPNYSALPPLRVPHIPKDGGVWFNEYTQPYDQDWYSVSQTVPVYLEIDNFYLKLSRPKGRISKRATCDEREYKLDFVNRRVYDLRHCRILLKPDGILRRRYFNKKYPIYVELGPESFVKAVRFKESTLEEEDCDVESTYRGNDITGVKSSYGREYLNLFARCNRQKEEWYRRLKEATKCHETKASEVICDGSNFEKIYYNSDQTDYDEYWQYMLGFVGDARYDTAEMKNYIDRKGKLSRKKKKDNPANDPPEIRKKTKGLNPNTSVKSNVKVPTPEPEEKKNIKDAELEAQWLNALINRFLFDIFRTPYWLEKIQAKVQKKLASIRLPYYIETVEVIEMSLGKVGPRFHRVSKPFLDERGLWFDIDLTFDGSFKIILQTQLNLIKLQKGLEEEVAKLPVGKAESRLIEAKKSIRNLHKTQSKVNRNKPSSKELLLEIAELVVADDDAEYKDVGPSGHDAENSESTESDEDDDDDDEYEEPAEAVSNVMPTCQNEVTHERRPPVRRSSKKIFRVMESVAQSRYFKSIAESRYVQKALEGVSATKLRLILEVKSCIGTIAINVPPPPNDRIWYGFRTVPNLWMSAQPKFGQKNIRFSHIKHFMERKILEEIKKAIVMPNMDDLLIPIPPDDFVTSKIFSVAKPPEGHVTS